MPQRLFVLFRDVSGDFPAAMFVCLFFGVIRRVQADITMGGGVSRPGMALSVEVVPGVICVMSPLKIRTMFRVLDYVTKASEG